MQQNQLQISVIIPVRNERENVSPLYSELVSVLSSQSWSFEVLFIDDGSTDGTVETIQALVNQDSRIRLFCFGFHHGKSAALACGFQNARGERVATLDGDLQDQPSEIIKLWNVMESRSCDLVSGWKKVRHDPWHKLVSSKLFNALVRLITGVPLHDFNCGIKLYRASVVRTLPVYGELHRFLPVLASWKGFRVAEEVVEHRPRIHGESKFGFRRMFGMMSDILTIIFLMRYEGKPSHLFGGAGIFCLGAGFFINAQLLLRKLFGGTIAPNYPYMILGVTLLIVGIQFVFFGLLSEMIVYLSRREEKVSAHAYLPESEKK